MKKILVKLITFILKRFSMETILEAVLKLALNYLTKLLEKGGLKKREIMFVQGLDALNRTLGHEWSKDTSHLIDDQIVGTLIVHVNELANKYNFELHQLGRIQL